MEIKKLFLILPVIFFSSTAFADNANNYIGFNTSKSYIQHINRGYIALDNLNYPLALKEFFTAKYINDSIYASYEGLGRLYEQTRNNRAIDLYQKALTLISPKYGTDIIQKINEARQRQDIKTALALYKKILSIRPEAGLQMLYGDKSKQEGNLDKALTNYKRAYTLQEDPNEYIKYVRVKYTNKEYERFIIRNYIQNNLRYPEAHFKSGMIHYERKNYYKAIEELKKTVSQITIPSNEYKYIYSLAQAYYKHGISGASPQVDSLNKAISTFEKYLKYEPEDLNSLFGLADSYFYKDVAKMNSYNQEHDLAEKKFDNIAGLPINDPEYIDNRNSLNDVLNKKYSISLFDKTFEILNRIENLDKFDPGLFYSFGNVYLKKAIIFHKGYYERYKYMNNEKAIARDKAWNYYQKTFDEYRKYIIKNPQNNHLIFYDLGIAYYMASKLEPDIKNLPVTPENKAEYQRWGPKYFKRDMLNRSVANLKIYLNHYPRTKNSQEVRNLISEMQLAMLNLW